MKKLLFTFLVFFSCGTAFSQVYFPLVEEGKVWSTYHDWCKHTGYRFSDYTKFEGDTVIGCIIYKKVWKTTDTNLVAWVADGQIRESNFEVYYLRPNSNEEFLIYDFMVNTGDTIYLHGFDIPYILDSIGMATLLNGEPRPIYYYSSPFSPGFVETWIEGVGSNFGIMDSGSLGMVGDDPKMMCFTENGILKYHNPYFDDCYVLAGINDPELNEHTLYPNPTSGSFTIQFRDRPTLPLTMEFHDLTGKVIKTIPLQEGVNPVTLQAPSSRGMYFYRLMDARGIRASGKLMVN